MKISVVTVCLNAESTIGACLDSVAEQTHSNIEHVVVDGLSTDGTVALVRTYPHVAQLVSERDGGLYDAMNKGLARVTGDYVIFLNADDRFPSRTTLADTVAAIAKDPEADVYYGSLEVRPVQGQPFVFQPPPPDQAAEFLITGCLPHQSTLAKPSVFAKTGPFDLRYRHHAEYDWFVKIIADPTIDVRSLPCTIGSFLEGGHSSQLAEGQPEVFAIQSLTPLYATREWDQNRIAAFQNALLRERLETSRLREVLRASERKDHANVARPRRLRWNALETCAHVIQRNMAGVFRRIRERSARHGR